MCSEDKNVYLNMLLVLDGLEDLRWKSFYDVADEVSYNEIPVIGGRGIVFSPDLTQPLITDSCVVVCCRNLALHLMKYRENNASR
jgi:hypothetical protein